jgi:hypothetical protein
MTAEDAPNTFAAKSSASRDGAFYMGTGRGSGELEPPDLLVVLSCEPCIDVVRREPTQEHDTVAEVVSHAPGCTFGAPIGRQELGQRVSVWIDKRRLSV